MLKKQIIVAIAVITALAGIIGYTVKRQTGALISRVEQKIQEVKERVNLLQKQGRNLEPVHNLIQRIGLLAKEGSFTQAEALLDQALALLKEKTKSIIPAAHVPEVKTDNNNIRVFSTPSE